MPKSDFCCSYISVDSSVTVSGMSITTEVGGNLLISLTNSEASFATGNLEQTISGLLEPVSTVNGTSFFYTTENVFGDGHTTDTALETYDASDSNSIDDFNAAYGATGAVGYVDYAFYLEATSSANNQNVVVSKINLLCNGNILGTGDKAWRTAIFAQEIEKETPSSAVGTLKTIVGPASAAYFEGKAASAANAFSSIANPPFCAGATIGTITTKGVAQRYKVVVRMYLEGNDTTCNNDTYALLTNAYVLTLKCELGGTATTAIQSATGSL